MKLIEFQKVAKVLGKEHKITIEEGQSWAASIKQRIVYYRKDDIYTLPEEHILGFLLHETAHIHYTTNVEMPDENKELFHTTLNMIEDISIENIISKDYPNAGDILASTKEEVLDILVKKLPKMKTSEYNKALLYAAARFENRGYKTGIENYEILGNRIHKIMEENKKIILDRKETKDLIPIVKKITELLINELGEPTTSEKQQMQDNNEIQGNANKQSREEEKKREVINTLKGENGWGGGVNTYCSTIFIDEIVDQGAKIGKQLRTVLKRNNSMEFGGKYRTGKLCAKRFAKIKIQKDRNPFTRRVIKSNQSYSFAIACDISGSMFGTGYDVEPGNYALGAMQMVSDALRYASIPRALITFGEKATTPFPIGKNITTWEEIASKENIKNAGPANTRINKAIEACTKELEKTRTERKIMIILTDGSSSIPDMKEAHKEATKKGIECLGITLGNSDPRYSMDEVFSREKNITILDLDKPELIGKAFIDILKNSIKLSK